MILLLPKIKVYFSVGIPREASQYEKNEYFKSIESLIPEYCNQYDEFTFYHLYDPAPHLDVVHVVRDDDNFKLYIQQLKELENVFI